MPINPQGRNADRDHTADLAAPLPIRGFTNGTAQKLTGSTEVPRQAVCLLLPNRHPAPDLELSDLSGRSDRREFDFHNVS